MADPRDNPSVRRVEAALRSMGCLTEIVALSDSARSAAEAAAALDVPVGAIVKSLVFAMASERGMEPVMALVAGDRQCDMPALGRVLGLAGKVGRADADLVRSATGFAIGGVAPLGHPAPLPLALDASLGRFATIYAAAGHPHCIFPTCLAELARLTGGRISAEIARG